MFPSQPADRESGKQKSATPKLARALRQPAEHATLSRAHPRQLWVAIHLPQLALEALGPSPQPSEKTKPVVVIDADHRQQIVLACNDAARAAGVRPGQSLNAAIVLASELEVLPRDATKERERLARLAAWCQQRFTPLVSLEPEDELLLEVKGSLRLFGGARTLLEHLAAGLCEQGVTAQLALTPTPRASLWLARADPSPQPSPRVSIAAVIEQPEALAQRLAPVPLRCLRWPEELLAQLISMGLCTVGDVVRLPRGGVVRRLGQAWLDELDRALGRRADVRRGFRSPQRFDARRALDHEIETTAGLRTACQPVLAQLQGFLRERQAAIAVLTVALKHRAHPLTRLHIGLAAPSGDAEHLRALLDERLTALSLPAPVIAIRLRSGMVLPATQGSRWLWRSGRAPSPRPGERIGMEDPCDGLPRLIERLRARLGNDAVFGVGVVEDHRPEYAWRVSEVGKEEGEEGRGKGAEARRRPLWLLAQPQKLSLTSSPFLLPSFPFSPFQLLRGPERIETGWWDGREVTRDYFVARDAHGVRLWIYRDRRAPHGWYVHGLFG